MREILSALKARGASVADKGAMLTVLLVSIALAVVVLTIILVAF